MKKWILLLTVALVPALSVGQVGRQTTRFLTPQDRAALEVKLAAQKAREAAYHVSRGTWNAASVLPVYQDSFWPEALAKIHPEFLGLPEQTLTIDDRIHTNLSTPAGMIPSYQLPSKGKQKVKGDPMVEGNGIDATRWIEEGFAFRKDARFKDLEPLTHKDFLVRQLPILAAELGGQITKEQKAVMLKFYRYPLQKTLLGLRGEKTIALENWEDAMVSILNLGLFGTAEDIPAIVEFAQLVPEDLIALTEWNVVFSLLNLGGYKELRMLAKEREATEHWFEADVPVAAQKSLRAHIAAYWYLSANPDLPVTASMIYPNEGFAQTTMKPWIPLTPLKKSREAVAGGTLEDEAKYLDLLAYRLLSEGGLMRWLLESQSMTKMQQFMSLKGNIPPVLQ